MVKLLSEMVSKITGEHSENVAPPLLSVEEAADLINYD